MKKILKTFVFTGLAVLLGASAANAANEFGDPCIIIGNLRGIFHTIRRLAFAGAAFVLAGWAWQLISKGWGGDEKSGGNNLDTVKNKGVGMLIGFFLLFSLGIVMRFLPGTAACGELMDW
jgi:hypothetical protein